MDFIARHRQTARDFTRRAIFTFDRVVGVLLVNLMRSLQVELDQFFSRLPLPSGRRANDDAFRMARKKLRWQAFVELNQAVLADLRPAPDWHGFRVVAGDSTTLYLPTTHPDTLREGGDGFGCYHTDTGIYSLARASALCEASTGLILRADLTSETEDERTVLASQLDQLQANDLLVLDRGYPAYWLFALLQAKQRHFCIRLKLDFSAQVRAFVASGAASAVIDITPNGAHRPGFAAHSLPLQPLRLRLVRVPLSSGQVEVLATSLLDEAQWPAAAFAALYQKRWRIEEAFRHLKCRLKLEQFGGETPQAIRQEFHAAILLHNLATIAAQDVLAQQKRDAQIHAPNLTHASHLVRLYLPQLLADPASIREIGPLLYDSIAQQVIRRRPDKPTSPRKANRKKPRHHRAYK
ncbi:hypothetical protein BUE93_20585 [Chromobacterium amazonense]|uniref:Transposase IS4-like domain-containing protein n=1 Tax=Chromobacterium amazonense TaxID=1382803 RepID=A0A2S9WZ70_9NEIS|nr:hypothetical protein BUE93_20585 [Chromobacterium amazonense]